MDILDSPHISQTQADSVTYNSQPPTSGPHFAFTAATGIYEQPVADGLTVHAMEHGHVIIHYRPDLPDDQRTGLERVARRYGADVILTPNPALERGIALTAWGQIDHLDRYDRPRIEAFVEALAGRYQQAGPPTRTAQPGDAGIRVPGRSLPFRVVQVPGSVSSADGSVR